MFQSLCVGFLTCHVGSLCGVCCLCNVCVMSCLCSMCVVCRSILKVEDDLLCGGWSAGVGTIERRRRR